MILLKEQIKALFDQHGPAVLVAALQEHDRRHNEARLADWKAAIPLLRKAADELRSLAWSAEGERYYGNDTADEIEAFLKEVDKPEPDLRDAAPSSADHRDLTTKPAPTPRSRAKSRSWRRK